jgi:hypothetical protein
MTDRLSLTNALADANVDSQKAERIAIEIFDVSTIMSRPKPTYNASRLACVPSWRW